MNSYWPEILAYENTFRCWNWVQTNHAAPFQSISYCLIFLLIHVVCFNINTIFVFDFDPKTILIFFLKMILRKESKTDCISDCLRQQHIFWKTWLPCFHLKLGSYKKLSGNRHKFQRVPTRNVQNRLQEGRDRPFYREDTTAKNWW